MTGQRKEANTKLADPSAALLPRRQIIEVELDLSATHQTIGSIPIGPSKGLQCVIFILVTLSSIYD